MYQAWGLCAAAGLAAEPTRRAPAAADAAAAAAAAAADAADDDAADDDAERAVRRCVTSHNADVSERSWNLTK